MLNFSRKGQMASVLVGAVLVGLIGTGCSKAPSVVGKWSGTAPVPANNPAAAAMANLGKVTAEFKADKTYTMQISIVPVEGTYETSGKTVTMKITKAMGMDLDALKKMAPQGKTSDMDKPMIATLSDDGKTLTVQPQGSSSNQPLVLTRDASSS